MISVKNKNKNKNMGFVILLILLVMLLSNASCQAATTKARFERFKGGAFASKFKSSSSSSSSKFHGVNKNGDQQQVFDGDKRKVYTGPNPLHNR